MDVLIIILIIVIAFKCGKSRQKTRDEIDALNKKIDGLTQK